MISEQRILELSEPILNIVEGIQSDLLAAVIRNISINENVDGNNILEWQFKKLQGLGALNNRTVRIVARTTRRATREIEELIREAGFESVEDDESIFKEAISKGVLNEIDTTVRGDANLVNIINASVENAVDKFNLTNTIALESASRQYLDVVNRVFLEVNTGIRSYKSAVRAEVISLADKGITGQTYATRRGVINYPLDAAIRRQIVSTVTQTAGRMQLERNRSYNNNLVEVTSHLGARPDHATWQGKIYAVDGTQPPFRNLAQVTGYGTVTGLQGANCRHQFFPYVLGLSIKRHQPFPKKLNDRVYKESQVQRKLENSIRKQKKRLILLDQVGDKEGFNIQANRLNIANKRLKAFKSRTGRTQASRVDVVGFNREISNKARAANRRE
jgi:hypothetical protein